MINKLLAIGVSSVDRVPGEADEFPYLDGAIVAAETIGQWALHSGFAPGDVIVLTDKGGKKVTDRELEAAFDQLLPANSATDHLIVAFAGHGMTGINDDITYWLLSDSMTRGYQVFVEELRRQLAFYGVQHLTIFSDACRAIAATRNLQTLQPRPGVLKRHGNRTDFELARFNACSDATSAYMVRDPKSAAPGKCIFSGVLAEALWGQLPSAFEDSMIDSASLGRGLRKEVKDRAAQYDQHLVPSGCAFFNRIIYFDSASPPLPPNPALAPWPNPGAVPIIAGSLPGFAPSLAADDLFGELLDDAGLRNKILGEGFGEAHPDIDTARAFPGLPEKARPIVENVLLSRHRIDAGMLTPQDEVDLTANLDEQIRSLEALAAEKARQKKGDRVRSALRRADQSASLAMSGLVTNMPVRAFWGTSPVTQVAAARSRREYRFVDAHAASLYLIEFDDGLFAPVYHYPGLSCQIVRESDGVAALSYTNEYSPEEGTGATRNAIARLYAGRLSPDALDRLATELRYEKHVNPMFGVIAAYCYDVMGDLNSIRRMAAYYAQRGQPVPYDIVLMGLIENNGAQADIPPVPRDDRRSGANLPHWLTAETHECSAPIAGVCPALRQGWDYIAMPEDVERPLVEHLPDLRAHLCPSLFTTFDAEGGRRFLDNRGFASWPGG